ncbi:outer envelope pore protein 37, chloroplastic isoform X2 [Magnolia sinica]|uniref:outer envelope pore protein 37, chloroplastic isoform X2 n=1 Tax=Magnolia sinica TaxID=86752 RepID=UPI002659BA1B|nr:outer envelope pore protein 37, chloroplastic isoform X2 [Magnolia sinica]
MVETEPSLQNPSSLSPSPNNVSLPESQTFPPSPPKPNFSLPIPAIRVTSEFDSDSAVFFHKISCKLFDRLAKLKLSFQNNRNGEISDTQISFVTKYLSILYDPEEQNALVKGSFDVGSRLQFRAAQDVKAQQGEVAMVASLTDSCKLELSSAVPSNGLPRATVRFPLGEVSVEEKEDEEMKRALSINGILKGQILNGVCTAQYRDDELNLRYSYKDEEMTFIPSISLPSNVLSFAFKRRFSPSDKLSYWYNFNSSYWSTVYKHTVGKNLKFKAGYDSEVRFGWASLWVGEEDGKAKALPMKMKVQFMLQVPQDNIESSVFMFRVKKRWDF